MQHAIEDDCVFTQCVKLHSVFTSVSVQTSGLQDVIEQRNIKHDTRKWNMISHNLTGQDVGKHPINSSFPSRRVSSEASTKWNRHFELLSEL